MQSLSLAPEIAPSVSGVIGIDGGLPWVSHAYIPQASPDATPNAAAAALAIATKRVKIGFAVLQSSLYHPKNKSSLSRGYIGT